MQMYLSCCCSEGCFTDSTCRMNSSLIICSDTSDSIPLNRGSIFRRPIPENVGEYVGESFEFKSLNIENKTNNFPVRYKPCTISQIAYRTSDFSLAGVGEQMDCPQPLGPTQAIGQILSSGMISMSVERLSPSATKTSFLGTPLVEQLPTVDASI